jgi:hypothetical protein
VNALIRGSAALIPEVVAAGEGFPDAVRTVARLARDGDRSALDALERLAERAEGLRRHALLAREAIIREREPSR